MKVLILVEQFFLTRMKFLGVGCEIKLLIITTFILVSVLPIFRRSRIYLYLSLRGEVQIYRNINVIHNSFSSLSHFFHPVQLTWFLICLFITMQEKYVGTFISGVFSRLSALPENLRSMIQGWIKMPLALFYPGLPGLCWHFRQRKKS